MKLSKTLAFMLAITMLFALACGCSNTEDDAAGTATVSDTGTASETDAPDATGSTYNEAEEADPYYVSLPLSTTNEVVDFWMADPPHVYNYIDSLDDFNESTRAIEDATGIDIVWTRSMDASTGLALMIASADMCDIFIQGGNYYSGGDSRAVEEGVFLKLNNYIAEYVPNYQKWLDENPDIFRDVTTPNGDYAAFFALGILELSDTGYAEGAGCIVRYDWLQEYGRENIEINSIEEYHDYLVWAKSTYGATALTLSNVAPFSNCFVGCYGVPGYLCTMQTSYPFYLDGDEVKYGLVQDEYREFMRQFHEWYEEGLLSEKYLSYTFIMAADQDGMMNDEYSMYWWGASQAKQMDVITGEQIFVGIPEIAENHFLSNKTSKVGSGVEISADTDQLELCLAIMNYSYTIKGSNEWYFGKQGVTFDYDEDGSIYYTDLITNNPNGWDMSLCTGMYTCTSFAPCAFDPNFDLSFYEDYVLDYMNVWQENRSEESWYIPSSCSIDGDDASTYGNIMATVATWCEEEIGQFFTDAKDIDSDEDWNEFVSICYDLDLQKAIDIYQNAYDKYMTKG